MTLPRLGLALAALVAVCGPAAAQSPAADNQVRVDTAGGQGGSGGWRFVVEPFAWAPSISGNVAIRGVRANVDASFLDILGKSDSLLAFMAHFEAQQQRWGLFAEPIYMRLGFNSPAGVFRSKITSEQAYLEVGGYYRAVDGVTGGGRAYSIDALGGGRYTHIGLSAGFAAGFQGSAWRDWVDPFVGGRARIQISDNWDAHLRADIGGFGVGSEFSWNVNAYLGYHFPLFGRPAEALIGYKALSQDYISGSSGRRFQWNNILYGPEIGLHLAF